MKNLLPGFKTYIGIGITLFGTLAQALGWDWWPSIADDVGNVLNQIIALAGAGLAIYGRAVAGKSDSA